MNVMANQGDTVDELCHRHLNTTAVVEQVLNDNPHIAFMPAVLPVGTMLTLPEEQAQPQQQLTQLWD